MRAESTEKLATFVTVTMTREEAETLFGALDRVIDDMEAAGKPDNRNPLIDLWTALDEEGIA